MHSFLRQGVVSHHIEPNIVDEGPNVVYCGTSRVSAIGVILKSVAYLV